MSGNLLSQNVTFDDQSDVATIYGMKISGQLLRALGEPSAPGVWFRIIKLENGVSTIEQKIDRVSDGP